MSEVLVDEVTVRWCAVCEEGHTEPVCVRKCEDCREVLADDGPRCETCTEDHDARAAHQRREEAREAAADDAYDRMKDDRMERGPR